MSTDTRHLGYHRLTVDDAPEPATPAAFTAASCRPAAACGRR